MADQLQEDIVEKINQSCPIDQVMEKDEFHLRGGQGRLQVCVEHDSLKVDVAAGRYYWNSKKEGGDRIKWVMNRRGVDFKTACEQLCREFGLAEPVWGQVDVEAKIIQREREDVLTTANLVFVKWLWASPDALAYCHGRGWTDETIRLAQLGYSGTGTGPERKEMANVLIEAGIDIKTPAAVAILGLHPFGEDPGGEITRWLMDHGYDPAKFKDWVGWGSIPGMIGQERLVYPFFEGGRVVTDQTTKEKDYRGGKLVYMTGRRRYNKIIVDEKTGKERVDRGMYNLDANLFGPMPLYYNTAYRQDADNVIVVEGQADAVSLYQMGYAAAALGNINTQNGLKTDGLVKLATKERHKAIYVGLDLDKGGSTGRWPIAEHIGPMARMLSWPVEGYPSYRDAEGVEHTVKDANDLLRAFVQAAVETDQQTALVFAAMQRAPTYVEERCQAAGQAEGAENDEAVQAVLPLIARMEKTLYKKYQGTLAKSLKINKSDLDGLLKSKTPAKGKKEEEDITYTLGGYINGWLIDYMYDEETERAALAWRDPDGNISSGDSVMIDGELFKPCIPDYIIKKKAVLFPSKLGEEKDLPSLLAIIELYIRSNYLLPSEIVGRLQALWVMLTWIYDCFGTTLYLRAMGDAGSGKSELMKRIGMLCYRLTMMSGVDTSSTLFRTIDRFRGTVFLEEADLQWSDASNDYVKIINMGAMKDNAIVWRNEKVVGADGRERYEPVPFSIFGPKLFAQRKDYKDNAVASRCLTFQLQARETLELVEAGISLNPTNEMKAHALAIRNLLLRWRLKMWQPEILIDPSFYELSISARLNQVAGPLLAMATGNEEQQNEIRKTLREYYAESIISKSMTIPARIIEAIWTIWFDPALHQKMVRTDEDGIDWIKIGDITDITNKIINEMQGMGDDEDAEETPGKGKGKKSDSGSTAQGNGKRIREDLQLPVSQRRRDGFWMQFMNTRMRGLSMRYGINPDDFKPKAAVSEPEGAE